jgi:hypothetical protein
VSVILYGDSHAQSTAAVQIDNPQAALSWSRGGCPTLAHFAMHDKTVESQCRGFNQEKLQQLKTAYAGVPVVLFRRGAVRGFRAGKQLSDFLSRASGRVCRSLYRRVRQHGLLDR